MGRLAANPLGGWGEVFRLITHEAQQGQERSDAAAYANRHMVRTWAQTIFFSTRANQDDPNICIMAAAPLYLANETAREKRILMRFPPTRMQVREGYALLLLQPATCWRVGGSAATAPNGLRTLTFRQLSRKAEYVAPLSNIWSVGRIQRVATRLGVSHFRRSGD